MTKNDPISQFSFFFLHPSDNPGAVLNSCTLNESNYDIQQKAMRNALRAKNKLSFVDGMLAKLAIGMQEASLWESSNSMLVS